ncbi:MAG: lactate racemase domain-containing protein [Byssovorax sp.]
MIAGYAEISWETVAPARSAAWPTPPVDAAPARSDALLRAAWATAPRELLAALEAEQVLLVVNDPCRSTRTAEALEALSRFAAEIGCRPRVRALVATGTHRFSAVERRAFEASTFPGEGLSIEEIAWHDAADTGALASLGEASINGRVAAARALIAVGSVEPHYFAGATGAHKTLTIGCLSPRDIEVNHRGALDPASDVLRLDGNPVHEGIVHLLASLREGRHVVAMNQVLSGAEVVAARVGDPIGTLHALLPDARRVYASSLDRVADVLHLRVPSPLGRSFYQADKALKNNHLAVADGGGILLEAECPDGVGQDAFVRLLRAARTYAEACQQVERDGYRLGDHKAVKLRHLTDPAARGVHIALISRNIPADVCRVLGVHPVDSVEEGLAWLAPRVRRPLARGVRVEDAGMACVTARPTPELRGRSLESPR